MRSRAKSSWELTGWKTARRSSLRWATSWRSSRRTTAKVEAVNPCLRAFWVERALPCGVRGPVDLAALARLAASCSGERGCWVCGMRLSFRFDIYHVERLESEMRRGQVRGNKGVLFVGWSVTTGAYLAATRRFGTLPR